MNSYIKNCTSAVLLILLLLFSSCDNEYRHNKDNTSHSPEVTTVPTPEMTTKLPDETTKVPAVTKDIDTAELPETTEPPLWETMSAFDYVQYLAQNLTQFDEIPSDEKVFAHFRVPLSMFDMLICESKSEKYTIYLTEAGFPEQSNYKKLVFSVPEEIEYDDYKVLPHIGGGGSGECFIMVEFTLGEDKSYYEFSLNLLTHDPNKWGIFDGHWILNYPIETIEEMVHSSSLANKCLEKQQ